MAYIFTFGKLAYKSWSDKVMLILSKEKENYKSQLAHFITLHASFQECQRKKKSDLKFLWIWGYCLTICDE